MPRTAEMVTRRIGQKQAKAATAALMLRLKPKRRSESGISATDGIGRSASMVSCAARSSGRKSPRIAPRTMPASAAMASASAAAAKVWAVCSRSVPSASAFAPATKKRLGREKPSSERHARSREDFPQHEHGGGDDGAHQCPRCL